MWKSEIRDGGSRAIKRARLERNVFQCKLFFFHGTKFFEF